MSGIIQTSCGCCGGEGPRGISERDNPPGQPELHYRVGQHGDLKRSMLARLSASDLPALRRLLTREDRDFTIALVDAAATLADVLAFYQERYANEHYLRTALERRSLRELARLIGYRPDPGVAANTWLAFTLDEAPGDRTQAAAPIMLPIGTRAQNIPGPDETTHTYETVEAVEARPQWNAIPIWASEPPATWLGQTETYVAGTANQLAAGDVVLLVGTERESDSGSERWDVRLLSDVAVDIARGVTRIAWREGLGHVTPLVEPANPAALFVFRQRASLFGHNAQDPNLLSNATGSNLDALTDVDANGLRFWIGYSAPSTVVDLDAVYPRIAPGSWFALVNPQRSNLGASLAGYIELYRATAVSELTRSNFGLSAKVTRLMPDGNEHLQLFSLRDTAVFAQSERLALAERPLGYPLYGTELRTARAEPDVMPGRRLAVRGKRARVMVPAGAPALSLVLDTGTARAIGWGDSLQIAAPPEAVSDTLREVIAAEDLPQALATQTVALRLRDRDGVEGTLTAPPGALVLSGAMPDDEAVAEIVAIGGAAASIEHERVRTRFTLEAPLRHVYDRFTSTVNANVAAATEGETVAEILGHGDAARPNQRFALKQGPLTYVSAATAEGRASTLAVGVNGIVWRETPTLFEEPGTARVHTVDIDDEGKATVGMGDGIEGARVPTGVTNVRARYRKGLGAGGNAGAGCIKTLISRPLGVTGVINPEPAYGGEDAEPASELRRRAPHSVLTLGRAVSVTDYADFARTFAGIAKAHAVRLTIGPARGMFVSVAGPGGEQPPAGGNTLRNLSAAYRLHGDALMPVAVHAYRPARFAVRASLRISREAADVDRVVARVVESLRTTFGFDVREFGEAVSQDDVLAAIHGVAEVEAVILTAFHRSGQPPSLETILWPALPNASFTAPPTPAEILIIDPAGIELGVLA